MREALRSFRLWSRPSRLCGADLRSFFRYGTLGDELGQKRATASLADSAGRSPPIASLCVWDARALSIDPNFLRAKAGSRDQRL